MTSEAISRTERTGSQHSSEKKDRQHHRQMEPAFLQRRHSGGQRAHGKMLVIARNELERLWREGLLRCWWGRRPVQPSRRTVRVSRSKAGGSPCGPAARSSAHTQTRGSTRHTRPGVRQPGQGKQPKCPDRRVREEKTRLPCTVENYSGTERTKPRLCLAWVQQRASY